MPPGTIPNPWRGKRNFTPTLPGALGAMEAAPRARSGTPEAPRAFVPGPLLSWLHSLDLRDQNLGLEFQVHHLP